MVNPESSVSPSGWLFLCIENLKLVGLLFTFFDKRCKSEYMM